MCRSQPLDDRKKEKPSSSAFKSRLLACLSARASYSTLLLRLLPARASVFVRLRLGAAPLLSVCAFPARTMRLSALRRLLWRAAAAVPANRRAGKSSWARQLRLSPKTPCAARVLQRGIRGTGVCLEKKRPSGGLRDSAVR